jgi:hypothetical protein
MMKRRQFLCAGPALLGAAAFAPGALFAGTQALDIRDVAFASGLSQAKFEALLGESVFIDADSGSMLAQIARVEGRASAPGLEQFCVWFETIPVPALADGAYVVRHHLAGDLTLHLQPTAAGRYRADFSLMR